MAAACKICNTRRPRRHCPGVDGEICPICCGTEREKTVFCPLECPYLREARRREHPAEVDIARLPNSDIDTDDAFLERNEPLFILLSAAVARGALPVNAVDSDVIEALDALTRTYRTLQSGLVYDHRPENGVAARVYSEARDAVAHIRERLGEGGASLSDDDVLGVLVALQRLGYRTANGRPKGRAFIDLLSQFFPPGAIYDTAPGAGGLIST